MGREMRNMANRWPFLEHADCAAFQVTKRVTLGEFSYEQHAFVLVPLSGAKERPSWHDSDELWLFRDCGFVAYCECPFAPQNREWKLHQDEVGGLFDRRVTGGPSLPFPEWEVPHDLRWDRNLSRVRDLQGPRTAYAVVTPDGLWHECLQPEPQDLVINPTAGAAYVADELPLAELSHLQLAWRVTVEELLTFHKDDWVLGV